MLRECMMSNTEYYGPMLEEEQQFVNERKEREEEHSGKAESSEQAEVEGGNPDSNEEPRKTGPSPDHNGGNRNADKGSVSAHGTTELTQ